MTQNQLDKLTGSIERVTFRNAENGYSVIKIIADKAPAEAINRDGTVAVVGVMPDLNVGEHAEFEGDWTENPKYGVQFKCLMARALLPSSERGITRFLASGLVKGLGEKTAEKIVDYFGSSTLDVLNNSPEALYEVPSLREQLATDLIKAWKDSQSERNVMIFLQGYGVSSAYARRIYDFYGSEAIAAVQENPYRLADEVFGIGFVRADQIAQEMGLKFDSPERIRAGFDYALSRLATEGHTYAPRYTLIEKTAELIKLGDLELIDIVLDQNLRSNDILSDTLQFEIEVVEAIYLPMYYYSELGSSNRMKKLLRVRPSLLNAEAETDLDGFISRVAQANTISLTDQQMGAVKAALTHKVTVLTGGPGTGKTTTLRMVIEAVERLNRKVALAAPTGRAAKRLNETTGRYASTIHRLLGFVSGDGGMGFDFNEDNPLEIDLLVIDECSMMDIILFNSVMKAVDPDRTHLMFVGDIDQLPSVGAGNVLRDIIDSGVAYVTRLDRIFRQGDDSFIVSNAHHINRGEMPKLDNRTSDFYFIDEDEPEAAAYTIVKYVTENIPERFKYDPFDDIQVLAPMYRGAVGVDALNEQLQQALNSGRGRYVESLYIGGREFREGDKVLQTRNNYDKNVFNGDSGRIFSVDPDDGVLLVDFGDDVVVYEGKAELEQLVHAYCISTHRSQGSEYPVVVMPVLTQHYMMLQRNLIYTAITRAKELVVLVGTRQAVWMAVNNNQVAERYCGLLARLRNDQITQVDSLFDLDVF